MMRSLYSGVSGMQNHQTRLDVIGNNVANVNTTGFKRGRVNFQDMISQQLSGAASPTNEIGGVNPKEVGLGVMTASIDTIFTHISVLWPIRLYSLHIPIYHRCYEQDTTILLLVRFCAIDSRHL